MSIQKMPNDDKAEEFSQDMRMEGRPKRGTTILPDGSKVIYDGDLTVLDKDGELVSWASSDLLSILWGDSEDENDQAPESEIRRRNDMSDEQQRQNDVE